MNTKYKNATPVTSIAIELTRIINTAAETNNIYTVWTLTFM